MEPPSSEAAMAPWERGSKALAGGYVRTPERRCRLQIRRFKLYSESKGVFLMGRDQMDFREVPPTAVWGPEEVWLVSGKGIRRLLQASRGAGMRVCVQVKAMELEEKGEIQRRWNLKNLTTE